MKLLKIEGKRCRTCAIVGNYLDSKGVQYEKIDFEEHPDIAEKYDVKAVPVLVLLDENDEIKKMVIGSNTAEIDELLALI